MPHPLISSRGYNRDPDLSTRDTHVIDNVAPFRARWTAQLLQAAFSEQPSPTAQRASQPRPTIANFPQ